MGIFFWRLITGLKTNARAKSQRRQVSQKKLFGDRDIFLIEEEIDAKIKKNHRYSLEELIELSKKERGKKLSSRVF